MRETIIAFILLTSNLGVVLSETNRIVETEDQPFRFITIGHTMDILRDSETRDILINSINSQNTDCVFMLGDCAIYKEELYKQYMTGIDAKLFCSPGNHDLKEGKKSDYTFSVGYLDTALYFSNCNFILLNSSESEERINAYVRTALSKADTSLPTILLTHHRIWDDNLMSDSAYSHDKSYLFREIEASLKDQVDYIFAGNSQNQYFGDQYLTNRKINKNNVFWCDVANGIKCYSVGMDYNISYVVGEISNGKLSVTPVSIKMPQEETIAPVPKENKRSLKQKVLKNLKTKGFWLGVIGGFVCSLFCGGLLFIWLNRTSQSNN